MFKTRLFYSHLVDISDLLEILEKFNLTDIERDEIYTILDDILHHRIMEQLLSSLPSDHHATFLDRFASDPGDRELIEFLKLHAPEDPEIQIITTSKIVRQEIILDMLLSVPRKRKASKKKSSR